MAGIYIHIPYCRKVCFYCDFHFTVSVKHMDDMIQAICTEAVERKDYMNNEIIQTIYFGGGTPSVLVPGDVNRIMDVLYSHYPIIENPEITFETNPDDLTENYLSKLKNETRINRLSIGIQSFHDQHLIWMNRRHTARDAMDSIKRSQDKGFHNINVDLIYGIPGMTHEMWNDNIDKFLEFNVSHLSAYHLTIEPDTIFGRRKRKGHIIEMNDDESFRQFRFLIEKMNAHGFDHYEISNFAKDNAYSRHNLNYWNFGSYIGLGPSAHSFNQTSRQWNLKVNSHYIEKIQNKEDFCDKEELTENEMFNEYVMVSLRTKTGIDTKQILNMFGEEKNNYIKKAASSFVKSGHIEMHENCFFLTLEGKFISDYIISKLFV